jgi:hypothetical protein
MMPVAGAEQADRERFRHVKRNRFLSGEPTTLTAQAGAHSQGSSSHSYPCGGLMERTTWFEFAILNDEDEADKTDVVARLTILLDIATKLAGAGLSLRLTMSGVAFEAPEDEVADQLAALGIEEPFASPPGRTLEDVCEVVGELHDALREGRLGAEGYAQLAAILWVLGVDSHSPEADRLEPSGAAA